MTSHPTLWSRSGSTSQGHHLRPGSQIVGRAADADVRLDSEMVSGRHAEVLWQDGRLTVTDLGSRNGTTVNGSVVTAPTILVDGDTVGFGPLRLTVELATDRVGAPPPPRPAPPSPASPRPEAEHGGGAGLGRVFISYNHRDRRLASRLYHYLERAGWEPWMADEDIAGGREWADQIVEGLRRTDAVVVVVTRHSMASEWVEREVSQAASARLPLIPLVVDGVRPSDALKLYLGTVQQIPVRDDDQSDFWDVESALLHRMDHGRDRRRATVQLRLGQTLVGIGATGFVLAFALFMFFAYQAIVGESASTDLSSLEDFQQRREESDDRFLRIAIAFPVAFASMVIAAIGEALRRDAHRKRI